MGWRNQYSTNPSVGNRLPAIESSGFFHILQPTKDSISCFFPSVRNMMESTKTQSPAPQGPKDARIPRNSKPYRTGRTLHQHYSLSFHGRGAEGKVRSSRHADGNGACSILALDETSEAQSPTPEMGESRSVCPFCGTRMHVACTRYFISPAMIFRLMKSRTSDSGEARRRGIPNMDTRLALK